VAGNTVCFKLSSNSTS